MSDRYPLLNVRCPVCGGWVFRRPVPGAPNAIVMHSAYDETADRGYVCPGGVPA